MSKLIYNIIYNASELVLLKLQVDLETAVDIQIDVMEPHFTFGLIHYK